MNRERADLIPIGIVAAAALLSQKASAYISPGAIRRMILLRILADHTASKSLIEALGVWVILLDCDAQRDVPLIRLALELPHKRGADTLVLVGRQELDPRQDNARLSAQNA